MKLPPVASAFVSLPTPLQPLRLPLRGSRLIEASAGTGKTFTIAALYVRLVLGHGDGVEGNFAYARPLVPPEILVVTFTDAATQELRERIRQRLSEAADYFLADPATLPARAAGTDLLHDLRAAYAPAQWRGCARTLQLAAEWMDEAAVATIHGWCNRMLREHAFDSDSLFTQRLETDQTALLAEVVRDYWRSFIVSLDTAQAAALRPWWAAPADLAAAIGKLLGHIDQLAIAPPPAAALAAAAQHKQQRLAELKAPWLVWSDELLAFLDAAVADKRVDKLKLQRRFYASWIEALNAWAADPQADTVDLKTGWQRLTPQGMAAIWTDGAPPDPLHPAFHAIATLAEDLRNMPNARADILQHAARWVAARFALEQERRAQMGFNELLTRLDSALQGPNGARLATLIRQQFPVALIDEFQDTDAIQYRIFDRIYAVARNDKDTALILIGDPKQAIYAFRGADIYTYLQARAAVQQRLYTLTQNFRATHAMVAATNHCFAVAEARPDGAGAFLFRNAQDNPVPFFPASAAGRTDALQVNGAAMPALTLCHLPPAADGTAVGKGAYLEQMAAVCAAEMVRLLNLGQQNLAGWVGDRCGGNTDRRPLRPADLAVLVNNRNEAQHIKKALAQQGVRSVYLSEQEEVYACAAAAEMQLWLAACAEPDEGAVLRAALATVSLGLSWAELDRLNQDELAWEARLLQFRGYQVVWRRQGVLPMLRQLLHDFQVPARLLADHRSKNAHGAGERMLTDLLHLAELLQQASTLLDGEHAVVRYLAEQRQGSATGNGAARQIRLESDADLVQVVTVFKAKGLEYPLVFLPFACAYRASKADDLPLTWHDEHGTLHLALDNAVDVLAQVEQERLGEDLRKLYVAMTRARYATWLGVAPVKAVEQSALGYLLGGGAPLTHIGLAGTLQTYAAACSDIAVVASADCVAAAEAPEASEPSLGAPVLASNAEAENTPVANIGTARTPQRAVRENWWIGSYSALHYAKDGKRRTADSAGEAVFYEAAEANAPPLLTASSAAHDANMSSRVNPPRRIATLHDFPRGPEAGTFLHDLLEWAANQGFSRVAGTPLLRDAIARRCQLRGWAAWIDPLTDWLNDFLCTEFRLAALPAPAKSLASLAPLTPLAFANLRNYVAEMEFMFAAHTVDAEILDALVCRHTLGGAARPALQPTQLHGMMKGFIDLLVEHAGRYYVIDYKSNYLGPNDAAYTAAAIDEAVLTKRYELQYVIYTLALHRLLTLRLPAYDYDTHVGGALYLFLRGTQAAGQGVHAARPPRALIEALDELFSHRTNGS